MEHAIFFAKRYTQKTYASFVSLFLASKYIKLAMKYLSQKDIVGLAEKQNKLTGELKSLIDKYYARYRLRIISEAELFTLLNLQK